MAESTLSDAYTNYREEIAFYLGYGRTSGNWSTDQESTVNSCLKSGLRQFYYPPKLPESTTTHDWSFMHPVTTLSIGSTTGTMSGAPSYSSPSSTVTATTSVFDARMDDSGNSTTITFTTSGTAYTIDGYTSATEVTVTGDASGEASGDTFTISAQYIYDLPDDFGGINGGFTYNSQNLYDYIKVVDEKQIRDLRQGTSIVGHPRYAAIRTRTLDATSGQRFEVLFYPNPNSSYTLTYAYIPLVDNIASGTPYPLGGMAHSETILASCLAVAEERLDDTLGEKRKYFMERLRASIEADERANTAETLGYNADNSHDGDSHKLYRDNNLVTVTV